MDIIGFLIAADCVHVRVNAFAECKAVFFQRIAFPFCKRLHNLRNASVLFLNIKGNGALNTV